MCCAKVMVKGDIVVEACGLRLSPSKCQGDHEEASQKGWWILNFVVYP